MSSRIESVRRNDTVLGDIEYDRHYPLQVMHSPIMQMLASPGFSDEVSVGVPRSREARHDPSAAELAEIESEKTKEKLRNKAERVSTIADAPLMQTPKVRTCGHSGADRHRCAACTVCR